MEGIAVATMVAASAARPIESMSATRIRPRCSGAASRTAGAGSTDVTGSLSQPLRLGFRGMTEVQTARGPVDTSNLGRTLMHEHIFVLTPDVQQNHDEWDEQAQVTDAIAKLRELKAAGFDTIVDPTVIGLGRYIPRIVRVAEQVDLNLIVATGVYTYATVPFYFHPRGPALSPDLPDPMVDMFVRDLTVGIPGTDGV